MTVQNPGGKNRKGVHNPKAEKTLRRKGQDQIEEDKKHIIKVTESIGLKDAGCSFFDTAHALYIPTYDGCGPVGGKGGNKPAFTLFGINRNGGKENEYLSSS